MIKYSGPGLSTSQLCMDKYTFFTVMSANNIPVLNTHLISDTNKPDFQGPYILKPRFGGSSIGVEIVEDYQTALSITKNSIQLKTSSIGSIGIGGSWSIFNPKPNQTLSVSLGHDTWTHDYTYYNYLGQKLKRLGANGERSEFNIFSRVLNSESNVWNSQSVYGISMSRGIPEPSSAAYRKGAEQTDNRIQLNNSIGWSKRNYLLEARQSVFYSHQSYTNVISDILDTNKYIVYSDDGHVLVITRYKNVARQFIEDYKNES